jgi:DNA-binding protein HU-beta
VFGADGPRRTNAPDGEPNMNKSEFIDAVAEQADLTRAAAARVVDAIFDTAQGAISQAVHAAGSLSIPGFGKFTKRTRAERTGRNPRTGAEIKIPERTTVSFSAGRGLKEQRSTSRRKAPLATAAGAAAGAALGAAAGRAAGRAGGSASSKSSGGAKSSGSKSSGGSSASKGAASKSGGASKSTASKSTASKSSGGSASKGGASKSGGSSSKSSGAKSTASSASKSGGAKSSGSKSSGTKSAGSGRKS